MTDVVSVMPQTLHKQEYDIDFTLTDAGNAQRLADRIFADFKYCGPLGGWFGWSGLHWKLDNDSIWARAREFGKEIQQEALAESDRTVADRLWRHGSYSLSEPGLRRMINLASKDNRISRSPNEFDSNPYLLNVLNGTIDLRNGSLQPHDRTHLLTKLIDVEYDPKAAAPAWDAFLERILPSEDLRRYVQKAVGYSFVGEVSEHLLLICYGTGRNGKGTFIETIRNAARAYVHRTRTEMLMAKRHVSDGPTPDLANLKGKRFVFASESDDGQRLNESLVKDLTGGDTINARHLNKEPMEFSPTHTLWLQTNHRPVIKGSDIGIWSRIRLLPFTEFIRPEERDRNLPKKLQAGRQGILAWIVEGALMWQAEGLLDEPEEVRIATNRYKDDMDKVTQFMAGECVTGEERFYVTKDRLYNVYKAWCAGNGVYPESKRKFGERLVERGYDPDQRQRVAGKVTRVWQGIGLLTEFVDTVDAVDASFEAFPINSSYEGLPRNQRHTTSTASTPDTPTKYRKDDTELSTFWQDRRLSEEEVIKVKALTAEGLPPKLCRVLVLTEADDYDSSKHPLPEDLEDRIKQAKAEKFIMRV